MNRTVFFSSIAIATAFACACGFMVLMNNGSIAMVMGQFIDSGSLLSDFHNLILAGKFNQSSQYHTSIYGWPGNNLALWTMWLLDLRSMPAQGIAARTLSFVFSLMSLVAIGLLLARNRSTIWTGLIFLLFVATWAPFVSLSYQIHPEPFGLFFATCSLLAVTGYARDCKRHWKLYVGWGFAVLATLSKQPYMVYLLPPFIVGFHAMSKADDKLRFFGITAFAFVCIGLVVVFLSDPYILIDFPLFLKGQIEVNTHHLDISHSLSTSLHRWVEIIFHDDPWFALGIVFSFLAIRRRNDIGLFAVAWVNIAFLAILVGLMKFFFLRAYLYPAIPSTILVIALMWPKTGQVAKTVTAAIFGFSILTGAVRSAGIVATASRYQNTSQARLSRALAGLKGDKLFAIYSADLPIPKSLFSMSYNNFQVGEQDNLSKKLSEMNPDILIVDDGWPYSFSKQYAAAASSLKMTGETIEIKTSAAPNCDSEETTSLRDCLYSVLGYRSALPPMYYSIYFKPKLQSEMDKVLQHAPSGISLRRETPK